MSHSHQLLWVSRSPADDDVQAAGLGRIRHVPHFVRAVAETAQHIKLVFVGARQVAAAADAHHLCSAAPSAALGGFARNVSQVAGPRRIGDVDNGGAVLLLPPGQRIGLHAGMMADVGDPAIALFLDHRLIRAAGLEIVVAGQFHVAVLGCMLRRRGRGHENRQRRRREAGVSHKSPPFWKCGREYTPTALSTSRTTLTRELLLEAEMPTQFFEFEPTHLRAEPNRL